MPTFFIFALFVFMGQAYCVEPLTILAATAITGLLSGAVGLIAGERAIDAQRKENRATRELNLKIHGENLIEAKSQFRQTFALDKKQFKSAQAQQTFDQTQAIAKNFTSMMNDNPRVASSFYQIAAQRRAT